MPRKAARRWRYAQKVSSRGSIRIVSISLTLFQHSGHVIYCDVDASALGSLSCASSTFTQNRLPGALLLSGFITGQRIVGLCNGLTVASGKKRLTLQEVREKEMMKEAAQVKERRSCQLVSLGWGARVLRLTKLPLAGDARELRSQCSYVFLRICVALFGAPTAVR